MSALCRVGGHFTRPAPTNAGRWVADPSAGPLFDAVERLNRDFMYKATSKNAPMTVTRIKNQIDSMENP